MDLVRTLFRFKKPIVVGFFLVATIAVLSVFILKVFFELALAN